MTSQRGVWAGVAVLSAAALLWAGDPWKEKPYTAWNDKEVAKVLQDSPWARPVRAGFSAGASSTAPLSGPERAGAASGPGGEYSSGSAGQASAADAPEGTLPQEVFIVQWASALTVRQALVRRAQLRGALNEEQAAQALAAAPSEYLIIVFGPNMRSFAELTEEALRASAYLQTKPGKQKVPPARIQFHRQGEQVLAVEFSFPRQLGGQPLVGPAEKKVEFFCRLRSGPLTADFEPRKMTREGPPDL